MYLSDYIHGFVYHKISHEPRRSSGPLALTISPVSFRHLPSPKLCFDISNNIHATVVAASSSSTRETFRPLIAELLIRTWSRSCERLKSLEIAPDCVSVCVCVLRKCEISTWTNGFFLLRSWTWSFTRPLSCKLIAGVCRFYLFFRRIFWIKCKILRKVWTEIFYSRMRKGYIYKKIVRIVLIY